MEKKKEKMINISSLLESYGMSFGVQLYSPLTGDCELIDYSSSSITIESKESKNIFELDECGRLDKGGVKVVFPSVLMMDWKKLLWKTGAVLRNKDGELCAFEGWTMGQHWARFNARFIRNLDGSLTKDSVLIQSGKSRQHRAPESRPIAHATKRREKGGRGIESCCASILSTKNKKNNEKKYG